MRWVLVFGVVIFVALMPAKASAASFVGQTACGTKLVNGSVSPPLTEQACITASPTDGLQVSGNVSSAACVDTVTKRARYNCLDISECYVNSHLQARCQIQMVTVQGYKYLQYNPYASRAKSFVQWDVMVLSDGTESIDPAQTPAISFMANYGASCPKVDGVTLYRGTGHPDLWTHPADMLTYCHVDLSKYTEASDETLVMTDSLQGENPEVQVDEIETCSAVTVAKLGRVSVKATNVSCRSARTLMARSARGLKISGYSCKTRKSGKARTRTCEGSRGRLLIAGWRVK